MNGERKRKRLPLWSALAPLLVALTLLDSVTGERHGLFPRWLDILVFIGALLLASLPFLQRLPRSDGG